jgi:hypothetical protein
MDLLLDVVEENEFLISASLAVGASVVGWMVMNNARIVHEHAVGVQSKQQGAEEDGSTRAAFVGRGKARRRAKASKTLPKGRRRGRPVKDEGGYTARWERGEDGEEEERRRVQEAQAAARADTRNWSKVEKPPPLGVKRRLSGKTESVGVGGEVVLELGEAKPAVIGKKGVTIQRIVAQSGGASIEMAERPSSRCTVSGTAEQVARAVELIQAIVDERAQAGEEEVWMLVLVVVVVVVLLLLLLLLLMMMMMMMLTTTTSCATTLPT